MIIRIMIIMVFMVMMMMMIIMVIMGIMMILTTATPVRIYSVAFPAFYFVKLIWNTSGSENPRGTNISPQLQRTFKNTSNICKTNSKFIFLNLTFSGIFAIAFVN